jgi:nucleotide-binding universal stress UspA family protein
MEFKKIVLTTDLSENADAAVPYAVQFAKMNKGTIYLLSILEDVVYYGRAAGGEGVLPVEWIEASRIDRQTRVKAKAEELAKKEGINVVGVMRQGHPANEIIQFAHEEHADCVVISTHGHTGLSHFIFGSVAERVVRQCNSPVLTIRPKKHVRS